MSTYWETAFDSLPDLISLHTKDHKIIKTNKAFRDFIGKNEGEIIGKCYEEIFGRTEVCDGCPLIRTVINEKTHTREDVIDGRYYLITTAPIYDNGDFVGIIHSVKDVTELHNKTKALAESEEKFRNIVERMSDGIAIVSTDLDTFHLVNPRLVEMSGYSEEELLNTPYTELFDLDSIKNIETLREDVKRTNMSTRYEARAIRKDGSFLNVIVSGGTYNGGAKRLVIFTDITELKEVKESLIDLREAKRKFRLGEILVDDGNITFNQLQEALKDRNRKLGEILITHGVLSEEILNDALIKQLNMNNEG